MFKTADDYQADYQNYYVEMLEAYLAEGGSADAYTCSHEAMTSDEVVGYYVECHGEMAYTRWKENLRIKGHNTNLDTVVELKLRGLQMIQ